MEEEEDLDEVDSTTEIEIVLENLGEGGLVGVVAVVGGGRSESPMEEGTRRWHAVFGGGSDLGVLGSIWTKMMFIGRIWLVWWCRRWVFAEEVPIWLMVEVWEVREKEKEKRKKLIWNFTCPIF
ncbi:uncharacterized protein LOC114394412 [Glycine soja]|uniref:uncharacterized protein LOC114394412 n=1 Tax=Glycine soja TaxID=3848 RepID=UPI00103D3439|nr:uncharacterized protein LOC114394412 [Glycine soja]